MNPSSIIGPRFLVALALLTAVLGTIGPSATPAADPGADATFRADAVRLLELTGSTRLASSIAEGVNDSYVDTLRATNPDIPSRAFDIVVEVVDDMLVDAMGPQLIEEMVDIYRRHFSHEEVRGLIEFYETPLGRKTVAAMPAVVGESIAAGQAWAERTEPRFQAELHRRLAEEGIVVQ